MNEKKYQDYKELFDVFFEDAFISEKEREELKRLQLKLDLTDKEVEEIEKMPNIDIYKNLFEVFYENSSISDAERELLNKKKQELGISDQIVNGIESNIIQQKLQDQDSNREYKYYAFISYSRHDEKYAKKLQQKIESYKLPSIIRKTSEKPLPQKIRPVFRDKTHIKAGGLLEKNLYEELKASKYLILVCSNNASRSDYVNQEIVDFIKINGNEDRIIPFIVNGTPDLNDINRCYPPALKSSVLGVSIREIGKNNAFIKVIAKILELNFDELIKRHKKRERFIVIRNVTTQHPF